MSKDTALLVIDAQVGLISGSEGAYRSDTVLANIVYLLKQARASRTTIIYVQHEDDDDDSLAPSTPGWYIHPTIAPLDDFGTNERVIMAKAAHEITL